MYVREDGLIIKLLFLKDRSTLCYSSSFSILLYYIVRSLPYGGSFTLYTLV